MPRQLKIAAVVLCLLLTGCLKHWRPIDPATVPQFGSDARLRVTVAPDSVVFLDRSVIRGDTIFGTVGGERCFQNPSVPSRVSCVATDSAVAYPLSALEGIDRQEVHTAKTVGMWIGIVGLPFAIWFIKELSEACLGPFECVGD